MPHDPLLTRLTSAFAGVPGVEAVVLGGSRARGNEKGALQEAAGLPLTIPQLEEQANEVWRLIGDGAFAPACEALRRIDRQLKLLTS
ncbi:hypothetical protein SAMN05216338_103328 [Bradyrhizobium sp. Rc2d]|uniref:hypothetical protein n=1 Tax=Bradyrhizobium sp. Rc2d TaxID=1855321 RepID=UPI000880F1FA|nr:hypothetical protein [Bradyrhizobium sp. Rc2d]SDI90534.1 hypothetical protein SAMN05216338_103328 [Bradyrhizobium sp. Rc2d]